MVLDSMAFIRSSVYRVPALYRGGRSDALPPDNTGMTLTFDRKVDLSEKPVIRQLARGIADPTGLTECFVPWVLKKSTSVLAF